MRAKTLAEFFADPSDGFVRGRCYLVWSSSEDLWGTAVWGKPAEPDVRALIELWDFQLDSTSAVDMMLDVAGIESVTASAFEVGVEFLRTRLTRLTRKTRRFALILPSGMLRAAIAGSFWLARPKFKWRTFSGPEAALAWLNRLDARQVQAELEHELRVRSSEMVESLRRVLVESPGRSLRHAARSLGVSQRTLQRTLRDAHTSFRAESARAQIEAAERLLLDPKLKVAAIARQVGFSSLASFAAAFRRFTGETPSAWRNRQRPR
jgi:AraC-like DNA-binding protein